MIPSIDRRVRQSTERRASHALEYESRDPVPFSFSSSLAVEVLRELVKGGSLLHRHEARDLQLLARLLHGLRPAGDALVGPLPIRGSLLADDLAALALDEVALLQAARGLLLGAPEDDRPRHLSPGDLGHPLLRLH